MTSLLWLRRDLRRGDHPALLSAAQGGPVVPVFVLDDALWRAAGPVRRAGLALSLLAARDAYEGRLWLVRGRPESVLPALAREIGSGSVHVTRETTPYGARRDAAVAQVLGEVRWVETGTPYAVGPGVVLTGSGTPYRVFTPFARAWREHGWPAPAEERGQVELLDGPTETGRVWDEVTHAATAAQGRVRDALDGGERGVLERWRAFREERLDRYDRDRDRPDRPGTSGLSVALKYGVVHPRTLLADLAGDDSRGAQRFRTELAWREFYADVLHHHPRSAHEDLSTSLAGLEWEDARDPGVAVAVDAWKRGRTGFPLVDAGMRQLAETGWMHNRVRMVAASFLVKDLHVRWQVGAAHFMDRLADGDLASNSHGWQWVAGTGTDASPYIRVFNPVTQARRFDPEGDYVRTWVPELAHLAGASVHEPWAAEAGYAQGYPERIVDHAEERLDALDRFERVRTRRSS